jgi:hypothetical protein
MNPKTMLAATLAVLAITGFSACNRSETGEQAGYQPGLENQVSEVDQAQVDETEQAVRGEEWQQNRNEAGTVGTGARTMDAQDPQLSADIQKIEKLQTGQKLSHYISRFEQMGWVLQEAQRDGDEMTLTLEKLQGSGASGEQASRNQGQRQGGGIGQGEGHELQVVLTVPEQGQQLVQNIEVEQGGLWGQQGNTNTSSRSMNTGTNTGANKGAR